jgi:hypothetical protein
MKHYALLGGILLLVACTSGEGTPVGQRVNDDLLSYEISSPDITLSTEFIDFPFGTEGMKALAETCHRTYGGRMQDIAESYEGVTGTAYRFHFTGESQDSRDFIVSVFPNIQHYSDIKSFQSDFESCYAGGDYYPHAISAKSIVFINGCGTGYDDGSKRPHGCEEAKRAVEQSIVPL